jgi:hypothetical protein
MGHVMNQAELNENPTVLLRRLHRWRMAFFGLVILLAGITIGAAGVLLVVRPEPPGPPRDPDVAVRMMMGRFRDELQLEPEQVDAIRAILHARMQNLNEIREQARPKIEAQLRTLKKEIEAVLTPEQRGRWERIVSRLEREFRHGMRRGPGRPGGPRPDDFPGGRGGYRRPSSFGPRDGERPGRPGSPRRHRRPDEETVRDRNDVTDL